MVKGWDYMRGMPPGGTLVINTHYTPDYMIRFVPGAERLAQLVCVDAAKIADHKWLYYRLGELGLDRLSTEGAAERNKSIAPDIAAPLIAAVVKTTGIVKMKTIEPMIANKHAFEVALKELHIMPLNPVAVLRRGFHVDKRHAHSRSAQESLRWHHAGVHRRKKGRTFSPPATGVRSGRCTATSSHLATTPAEPTKKSRAISTW